MQKFYELRYLSQTMDFIDKYARAGLSWRLVFSLAIICTLTYLFWAGSRYPALDEKAMMSGAIQLEDPLGFEALFPLNAEMTIAERVLYSTLNWINTNKKGMIFGILFAAAFLTAASNFKQKSFGSGIPNALLGMFIGTPLGVCVNCAAPIAKGMYSAGLRAETTLAAMIASPTLNVVILTMLFSLLPVYMVVAKITLSLFVILLIIPLICGTLLPGRTSNVTLKTPPIQPEYFAEATTNEPIHKAAFEVIKGFGKNLWFIIKMTVPLMLLAGFLGALAATLLPGSMILGLPFSVWLLLLVAAVGVFLPVPIAFDVVVCGALLTLGVAPGYVMALLFTLGAFSIYSFFIVAQAISTRIAVTLTLAIALIGAAAGLAAQSYHNWQSERALDLLLGGFLATPAHAQTANVEVTALPFAQRSAPADAPFTRLEAREVGIGKPLEFSFKDMWPPFWEGRSVASGDIDRDGDLDLVVASDRAGLYIYKNDGTGQFSRDEVDLEKVAALPVFNAALVDLNNDGWQDLFLASYRQGNWVVTNDQGRFDLENMRRVDNVPNAVLSLALAFDDIDLDGDLDAAIGNWAAGWYRRVPGEESRNRLILNQNIDTFGSKFVDLPAIPGETLSALFSDINRDGAPDLLMGNDFEIPDAIYMGDGAGGMQMLTYQDAVIPQTTTTTMAIKSADLFNDGTTQLYFAQIAGRSSGVSETLKMQPIEQYCDAISDPDALKICQANMEIKTWYKSGNSFDPTYASRCQTLTGTYQAECKAMLVKDLAIQRRDPKVCNLIPASQPDARSICDIHFWPTRRISDAEKSASIPQILRSNVLLEPQGDAYVDTAETRGLDVGGWSWDTKIADFDLDGHLDVYIVNGTWVPNEVTPSNLFFHNDGSGSFREASGPFGLEDFLMTASATQFDMDNDGDLDLVTHPVNGPMILFRNNAQVGNAIAFQLVDEQGNYDGIGARLEITYAGGKTQSREIQLGGGFMSFDAPRVHFGLGDVTTVDHATIFWRTGPPTEITQPLQTGALYTVTRRP